MKVKISAPDFGLCQEELKKFTRKFGQTAGVTIGFHAGDPDPRTDKDGKRAASNAEKAAWNHFGTKTTPARPFLDVAILNRTDFIKRFIQVELAKGKTPLQIMESLGPQGVRAVQEQIDETLSPPNAPSTIRRKGSSKPLQDSGNMRQHVTYRVHKGEK